MKKHALTLAISASSLLLLLGSGPAEAPALTEREKAIHALNRLGFGPRPGDVERVMAAGVDRWIAQQLNPERIADAELAKKLASFEVLSMSSDELYEKFAEPFFERRRELAKQSKEAGGSERPRMRPAPGERPQRIVEELSAAKLVRAVESNRQLEEVMADFWLNHFNVSGDKGADRILIATYERDSIRPHMWGRFEELLLATAKSPAMLFYLDNARSVATEANRPGVVASSFRRGRGRMRMPEEEQQRIRAAGLNENYARELLELHTLGVDGGYRQQDVTELARLLTGWSITGPREGELEFLFRREMHDVKSKVVLGHAFAPGGGIEEGEQMLRALARHPSTARHIATKLCQRLVADEPPSALVDRVAKRFLETGGDIRETVGAVVTSPEFFDPAVYRAKVKTPFEYTVSAIRAMGGTTDGLSVARQLAQMGQPLYLCQPPTGYSDAAEDWVSSGALVARLNFAIALAEGKMPGTKSGMTAGAVTDGEVDALASAIVGGELSASTRKTIEERIAEGAPGTNIAQLVAGLVLGSPEFQRQ